MPIQLKRYDTTYLTTNNIPLKSGEMCLEFLTDGTIKAKIGKESNWNTEYYPFVHTRGDNSFSGVQDFNRQLNKNMSLRNYAESVSFPSISSNVLSIDLSSGNVVRTNLNANITGINISSLYPSGFAHSFTLIFDYIDSGRSITWPSNILWNGGSGSVPVLNSGINRSAVFSFLTTDGGVKYLGFQGGNNFGV